MNYASTQPSTATTPIRQAGESTQLNAAIDIKSLKAKMKATWMDGDYAGFAKYMKPGAVEILENWQIKPGEQMLDVACGAGQISIPAATAGVRVTGIDIAENLVSFARKHAAAEGVNARFDEGDAEELPYGDAEFDVVTSMLGAMFAPGYSKVAAELARVCRTGGRLCMANWTPTGMVGQMFKRVANHVPPPPGVTPPPLWGNEETVHERLGGYFSDFRLTRKNYPLWRFPFSAAEVVDYFRTTYGPVKRAFEALDAAGQQSLHTELEAVFTAYNKAQDGTIELVAEYLDVMAVRR